LLDKWEYIQPFNSHKTERFSAVTFLSPYVLRHGVSSLGLSCILVEEKHKNFVISLSVFLNLIFKCPFIVNVIPNYNLQDATFHNLFIYTDAVHVSGGSSTHHQENITVYTASVLSTHTAAIVDDNT